MDQARIDSLRDISIPNQSHFINGTHLPGESGEHIDVVSPINGEIIAKLAKGTAADMDKAVGAARAAFDDGRWRLMAPAARKKVLHHQVTALRTRNRSSAHNLLVMTFSSLSTASSTSASSKYKGVKPKRITLGARKSPTTPSAMRA